MRILVAEDDRVSRFALVGLLRQWGYDVVTADNGEQAWDILSGPNAPRLAILDWRMPGMTGVEVCSKTRAIEGGNYVYIALLTAREQPEDIIEGFDAGADDYIIKPFDPGELRGRLRAAERILGLHTELDAIYNAAPAAMMLIDRDMRVRNVNRAAIALTGQSVDTMLDLRPGNAVGCHNTRDQPDGCGERPACMKCSLRRLVMKTLDTGQAFAGEEIALVLQTDDGFREFCFLMALEPMVASGEDMLLLCLEDITDRKKAETALADLNRTLEARVERRATEVYDLLRQKDEFVNQLGHDLKTPLVPLVALLPLAEQRTEDPKLIKMLQLSIRNVGYMQDLVEKILHLAQLNSTATPVTTESVDLLTLTRNVVASLAHLLDESQIAIDNKITSPLCVLTDPMELKEVFHNLISNAVKYTDRSGTITIDARPNGNMVTLSLTDTGIGMTPQQTRRVFDEFYKADEARGDHSSTGLGLSICRHIVERHRGRIWAMSPGIGLGTTIYFMLPAARGECEESKAIDISESAMNPGGRDGLDSQRRK
jgi:signal transduction histidine kinase/DNA-binding response OmpR family regulator